MSNTPIELLTYRHITELYKFPRQTIYRYIKDAGFPPPRQLGLNSVRFIKSEVEEWILARPVSPVNQGCDMSKIIADIDRRKASLRRKNEEAA